MDGVPVTSRALTQRIQRKLKTEGSKLYKSRTVEAKNRAGEYYIVDTIKGIITETHVDLKEIAYRIKVLEPFEYYCQNYRYH